MYLATEVHFLVSTWCFIYGCR